jgi:hypothetical protein
LRRSGAAQASIVLSGASAPRVTDSRKSHVDETGIHCEINAIDRKFCCGLLGILMKLFGAVFFLSLISSASSAETGLAGSVRNAFVENAFKVCLQKLQNSANDARFSKLAQYCVCYSNHLADRLSPEDDKALDELYVKDKPQLAARLRPILDGLAEDCAHALTP